MNYPESGYVAIQWLQSWRHPVLDGFFISLTALGMGQFYLIAIPIVYWCISKSLGARLAFLFLFGMFLNSWVKYAVALQRPDPSRVAVLFSQSGSGYSFPSGHAQGSLAFWGYCVTQVRKVWFGVLVAVFVSLMCLSRLYLGLHFPVDIAGGLLLAIISLLFFFVLLLLYEKIRDKVRWPQWIALIGGMAAVFIVLFPEKRFATILGSFVGFFSGTALEGRFVQFQAQASFMTQAKKMALGFAGAAMCVHCGLPNFAAYSLASAWVALGAPYCFKKMGWA